MRYELIGKNDYSNVIETIAKNRGVKNSMSLLFVSKLSEEDVCHHYSRLDNLDRAVDLIVEAMELTEKREVTIMIIVDSDADGYTSSAIVFNYLKKVCPDFNIIYHVHENENQKAHGVYSKDVPEGVDLVIVPDAGTHSAKELSKLASRGIPSIVLDHHQANNDSATKYSIVVNNQMCDYPNKELSGAGIVYKFCQALDDRLGYELADNYLDLVAIGMIADMMDTTELETRYYMKRGMSNISNPFLKAIVERQSFMIKGTVDFKAVSWYMAPLINATVRFGTLEERENMFEAFIENNPKTLPYKKRGETEEIQQPIAEAMARICSNVKGRQDRARAKVVDSLIDSIEDNELCDNKLLVVDATKELGGDRGSLTGLVAMQLSDMYKKPTIVLREDEVEEVYGGSGRNFNHSPIESFLEVLRGTELFNFVQGHDNAFGHQIKTENIDKMIEKSNEMLSDIEFDPKFTVDFEIVAKEVSEDLFYDIAKFKSEWGFGFEEPYIAIRDIQLNQEDIDIIGKKKDTLKFTWRGIEYIKFKMTEEEIQKIRDIGDSLSLTVVGRADTNIWNGTVTPQLIVSGMNYKPIDFYVF